MTIQIAFLFGALVGFAFGIYGYSRARRHAYLDYVAAHQRQRQRVFCMDCIAETKEFCVCAEGFDPVTRVEPVPA